MDSADDLSGHWLVRTTSTWDYSVGPLRCGLVRELFRHQQCYGLRRVWTAYSGSGRWVCFTGQPRTVQEYKGQGSKVPLYLGLDRRMGSLLSSKDGPRRSDRLGGVCPNKVYATLEIRACKRNYQCTPARKINSIDSRVHGNRTLYAEARSYHYKLYLILVGSEFCFLAGMSREGTRRHD